VGRAFDKLVRSYRRLGDIRPPSGKRWIGSTVELLRDVVTKGGRTFREGVVMTVTYSTSGGLSLRCRVRGSYHEVTGVSRRTVAVITWGKVPTAAVREPTDEPTDDNDNED
jgi:hypothetical protein